MNNITVLSTKSITSAQDELIKSIKMLAAEQSSNNGKKKVAKKT